MIQKLYVKPPLAFCLFVFRPYELEQSLPAHISLGNCLFVYFYCKTSHNNVLGTKNTNNILLVW